MENNLLRVASRVFSTFSTFEEGLVSYEDSIKQACTEIAEYCRSQAEAKDACNCDDCTQISEARMPEDMAASVPKNWCYGNRFLYGEGGIAGGLKAIAANVHIAHAITMGMRQSAKPNQSAKELADKIIDFLWCEIGKEYGQLFDRKDREYLEGMIANHFAAPANDNGESRK